MGYFRDLRGELSEESQTRLELNPLRILDSKDERDRAFVADAPRIDDFLSGEAQDFFGQVTRGLDAAAVTYTRAPALVRGLDYYRHTAFEFVTDRLGAQGTVLGGGRYDGLIETLGGPPTPAVGWAAGIERLAMLVGEVAEPSANIGLIADESRITAQLTPIACILRRHGLNVVSGYSGKAKAQFAHARMACPEGRIVARRRSTNGTLTAEMLAQDDPLILEFRADTAEPRATQLRNQIWTALGGHFDVTIDAVDESRALLRPVLEH